MAVVDRVKRGFVTGLVLLAPLIVTAYVLKLGTDWLFTVVDPLIAWTGLTQYTANDTLVARLLALLAAVSVITVLGHAASWSAGRRVFGGLGRLLTLVPLVSTIYTNVKRVSSALGDSESRFDRAVLVEYPAPGTYVLGLVTGESLNEVESVAGPETYNVYLPNSPNPTNGRLLFVPEERIHEIDISVRKSIQTVVTTGIGEEEGRPMESVPTDRDGSFTRSG